MRRSSLGRIRAAVSGASVAAVCVTAVAGSPLPATAQTLSWSVVPSPSPTPYNQLDRVSCASATACMAVGYDYNTGESASTLIESFDGTSWSVVPSPSPGTSGNFLYGVSCASPAVCMAVGAQSTSGTQDQYTALIEAWDGASWSVVPGPGWSGLQLQGVSCVSATACTAVGARKSGTLIESWNGTSWSIVPSPNPSGSPQHSHWRVLRLGERMHGGGPLHRRSHIPAPDRVLERHQLVHRAQPRPRENRLPR